jgi:hypothetical protein
MAGLIRLLIIAVLGLVLSGAPVAAQDIRIEPIPPHVKPQWTPVPDVPGVFWAPNIPTDVFRHGTKYYFYWEEYLYQGNQPKGPWKSVTKAPDWLGTIAPKYFKTLDKKPGVPPEGLTAAPPAPAPEAAPAPPTTSNPEKKGAPTPPAGLPKPPKVM